MSIGVVARVKAELEARGVELRGPCGAFAITGRVAWRLRGDGWGLIHKESSQNGCVALGGKYGVDAIMQRSGRTIDLLINSETENRPAWQELPPEKWASPGAWRVPFEMETGVQRPPVPAPFVPDPPVPGDTRAVLVEALAAIAYRLDVIDDRVSGLQMDVRDLDRRHGRGLTGRIFGYAVTLVPPE